jgi:hypothetical protein
LFEGTSIFLRLGNLSFIKPVYKKVTYFGLNSLRQKGKQILVKNWIFDDSIHFLGTSIGHFGARDDQILRIRRFFEEIGL